LHIAAMRGSQALLDLLLAHGASREQADPSGRTAADWAQSKGHAALAARLGELEVTIAIEPCMQRVPMERVWQSGIKALDLFAPIAPGALVRVEGGPGAGRNNVLLAELAHNATSDSDTAVLWVSCVACAAEHHDVHRRPVAGRRDAVLAPPFDTLVAFDPVLAKAMHFPALDPLGSCSRPLPGVAGYDVADAARSLLRQDQHRAQCLRAYLTQPFFVAEPFSGRPGLRVARADMLADVATLLGGAAEALHPKQLLYRGRLPAAG
jgi:F0F1-type ATP synthase beta subunit